MRADDIAVEDRDAPSIRLDQFRKPVSERGFAGGGKTSEPDAYTLTLQSYSSVSPLRAYAETAIEWRVRE